MKLKSHSIIVFSLIVFIVSCGSDEEPPVVSSTEVSPSTDFSNSTPASDNTAELQTIVPEIEVERFPIYATDNQFLGVLTFNHQDPLSICNLGGVYGNPNSSVSFRNPHSIYGTRFHPRSAYDKRASLPPRIYKVVNGQLVFKYSLTRNRALRPQLHPDVLIEALCGNI